MLNIKKILLLVDFPDTSLPVIHQAATLARHFQAEIVMLHVATRVSREAGIPGDATKAGTWNMIAEVIRQAKETEDDSLETDLAGLKIRPILSEGDATEEILLTARSEMASVIMMSSYGHAFDHFLIGTLTPRMVHGIECPVWTDASIEESGAQKFVISNVLCAVDFREHSQKSVLWANQIARDFGARLKIAHVTAGVEFWGPGGHYVNQEWKNALVGDATERMKELLEKTGVTADVSITSGSVSEMLHEAADNFKADVLVTGCQPYGGYLRTHGYTIIRAMKIPVVSV